jgi:sulfate permease, SulP family
VTPSSPIAPWRTGYQRSFARLDLLAGLSAAAVVLPQAIAYATIAGLPVQVGLYCALVPMVVYALLGTSRPLSVSTTSTVSLLTAGAIAVAPEGTDPLTTASTLAVLAGAILVLAGVLRLGFVADFISRPVLVGFKIGMGITIAVGQLGNILGVSVTGNGVFEKLGSAIKQLPDASIPTVLVASVTVVTLLGLHRVAQKAPGPLVVLVGGIAAVALFGLPGVATIPDVPTGLPAPMLPDLSLTVTLLPVAAGVALMAFTESISAGRAFRRREDIPVNADRELIALGTAGIAGGFFRAYPASGGLSQTAANDQAGARSQAAELVTAATNALTLLVLAPVLSDLPFAVLAGIVVVVAIGLADPTGLRALRTMRADEYGLALAAATSIVLIGILEGILVGIILSILVLLWAMNHPPIVILGRDSDTAAYVDTATNGKAVTVPGLMILRVESRLYFANARPVTSRQQDMVLSTEPLPSVVLLDASSVSDLDVTAIEAFEELHDTLAARGVETWYANLHGRTRELTEHRERWETRHGRLFPTIDAAVDAFQQRRTRPNS